ncbi:hypothetical protein ES332_A06G068700v1 [Gossypium tomentosum]|uniref:Uncharacterized protein n=1 Tax=Gossypium tomentosum TaxID=34277 RepID=A0A5D2Q3B7_GOSTO|nr:hypothetical protein ES332_A06G068700v1 [Gossypium tomentosum]
MKPLRPPPALFPNLILSVLPRCKAKLQLQTSKSPPSSQVTYCSNCPTP